MCSNRSSEDDGQKESGDDTGDAVQNDHRNSSCGGLAQGRLLSSAVAIVERRRIQEDGCLSTCGALCGQGADQGRRDACVRGCIHGCVCEVTLRECAEGRSRAV